MKSFKFKEQSTTVRLLQEREQSDLRHHRALFQKEFWHNFSFDKIPYEEIVKMNKELEEKGIGYTPALNEMSRVGQIEENMKAYAKLHKYTAAKGLHDGEGRFDGQEYYAHLPTQALTTNILNLHFMGFMAPLKILGDDEQVKKWEPLCRKVQIIGCYAQTELAHGSDVMNLQTTATYDKNEKVFILNSPTLESIKFWPGLLGKISNHALVVAQLVIDGKKYGVQTFIVNHRDRKTHKPLPGVEVNDIGDKMALHQSDNGWMRLNNVKIPRENMLCRFAKVTPEGEYIPPNKKEMKMVYASMLTLRVYFTAYSTLYTGSAATVAIRYSVQRTQFRKGGKGTTEERKLLDYQNQQAKLFPILASVWAFSFSSFKLQLDYRNFLENVTSNKTQEGFKKGAFRMLPDLHSSASCLKAFMSDLTLEHLNMAIHACGGHGFLKQSGLPMYWIQASAYPTMEGDNSVLYQQTARYLIKCYQSPDSIRKGTNVSYLSKKDEILEYKLKKDLTKDELMSKKVVVNGFRKRVIWQLEKVGAIFMEQMGKGLKMGQIWNEKAQPDIVKLAQYHSHVIVVTNYYDRVAELAKEGKNLATQVFSSLRDQFVTWLINRECGSLLCAGFFNPDHISAYHQIWLDSLEKIRPHAVNIVDSFGIRDGLLQSTIGHSEGGIYERIMDHVLHNNPTASMERYPGFDKYIWPILKPKL